MEGCPIMTEPALAEILARGIAAVRPEALPGPVRRVAEDLVLDVVGLCLAARHTDYVAAALGAADGEGRCTVIGHARPLDSAGAALVKGTGTQGEEFDG